MDYDEAGAIPGQKKDMLAKKEEEVGLLEGIHNKGKDVINNVVLQTSSALTRFLENWFGIVNAHHYFFLALLGVFTAALCFCVDLLTVYLIDSINSLDNRRYRETLVDKNLHD